MTQTTPRQAPLARATGTTGIPVPGSPGVGRPAGPDHRSQPAAARRRSLLRGVFEGSPGRLRLAGIAAVVVCLVFALLGALAYQARGNALSNANADAAQLIRVQQIATEVVTADSLLTSTFPTPEKETTEQLAAFNTALSNAAQIVAEASAANPDDAPTLKQVGDGLVQYTQYATNARNQNLDHNQVGFGYLRQAGAALRQAGVDDKNPNLISGTGLLPALAELSKANTQRVDDAYSTSNWATLWMVLADAVALAGLILVQVRVARRTHRILNLPLVAATVGVLVVMVVGAVFMVAAQSRANNVRNTSYTALKSLSDARINLNTAKSDAAISFLYQRIGGDYSAYSKDYQNRVTAITTDLDAAGSAAPETATHDLQTWTTSARGLFSVPDDQWKGKADALASPSDPFNQPFVSLDAALADGITRQASDVDTGLGNGNTVLALIGWVALVVGLLAAVASWAGISQRLEDYR